MLLTPEVEKVIGRTRFAIDSRQGMTGIFGDVGLGKTSILRFLWMDYKSQEDAVVAMIPTPDFPRRYGFITAICDEFGVDRKRSERAQYQAFTAFVTEKNRAGFNVVLFIDEGQKLTPSNLEYLRGFLNFEKPDEKLVQIVLAAQLELRDRLIRDENESLYQRLYAPSMLNVLAEADTCALIAHRCSGFGIANPFSVEAMQAVHRLTAGVPRKIIGLCGQAYEVMLRVEASAVDARMVQEVFADGDLKGATSPAAAERVAPRKGAARKGAAKKGVRRDAARA
jgi:general secretion pathway protein A